MTTNTTPPTTVTPAKPGAVIDIKLSDAAMKHAGSAFTTPLGTSLNTLFNAHKQAKEATQTEGTLVKGNGFTINVGNDTTVSVNGFRIETPPDKQGTSFGFVVPQTITVTQANASSSVITGAATYSYERTESKISPYASFCDLTRFQYNTVDTSPSSALGNTSTQINGTLNFLESSWVADNSRYDSYLTGQVSELSFRAAKLLKSATVKGDLKVSVADVYTLFTVPGVPTAPTEITETTEATEIAETTSDAPVNPASPTPTPSLQVVTSGSISSVNAAYYDGSHVRVNTGAPVAVTATTSLLGALANAELWAGNDKVSIIVPEKIEQTLNINTGAGNDTIIAKGGKGELIINTGTGDDLITLLDNLPSLSTGEGTDTLRAGFERIEMVRYFGLENLVFTGGSAASIDGNLFDNQITGGNRSDTISGAEGNDTLNGLAGHDTLNGELGDDRLFGGTGNDTLNGGEGNDALYGGAGNDIYIVDGGEIISEARSPDHSADSGGIDEVRASTSYALGANLEKLTLLGEANLNGNGNALANTLTGNSGRNTLKGDAGNDLMKGEAGDDGLHGQTGDDTLWGAEGNDGLDGGKGADAMWGGSGDDIYYVDHVRDRVSESVSAKDSSDAGGEDTVYSSVSFTLADRLEHLILQEENPIHGTGNGTSNIITGNRGDNVLDGKGGIDVLSGENGSDIYLIGHPDEHSAAEIVDKGAEGVDEVRFSPTALPAVSGKPAVTPKLKLFDGDIGIERVVIGTGTGKLAVTSGKIAADVDASAVTNGLTIIGNAGANELIGTAFDDTLIGNGGKDMLAGGAGKDKFVFNISPNAKTEVDTLRDFTHGEDQLLFLRSKFANIGPAGDLAESAFHAGAGATKAHDADDRFVFDTDSGSLYFDRDGSGGSAAVLIGVMTPGTQLSATDFKIVEMI